MGSFSRSMLAPFLRAPRSTLRRLRLFFGARQVLSWIRYRLPEWPAPSDEVWAQRHRWILILLWLHALGFTLSGLFTHHGFLHTALTGLPLVACALVAGQSRGGRRFRAISCTIGLLTSSALLVSLSGGYIEMHFHFFVMLSVMMLYQDWIPFLVAVGYVVAHHGIVGVLAPTHVYNHSAALEHPWTWAALHAGFVVAGSVVNLVNWRLNEHQALYDSLTKMGNRTLFLDRLAHALARRRTGSDGLAVLFLDLDAFKQVNDSLGHTAGDQVLVQVANRLKQCLRAEDTLARLGGDEFAILLEDLPRSSSAAEVAERLIQVLESPFDVWGKEVFVRASVGIAFGAGGGESLGELLRNADVAMYKAKAKRTGGYEFFAPTMHEQVVKRLELETELRKAVEHGELSLEFQPMLCLQSERVAGVEALVRWRHPRLGTVAPLEFIPVAEETGLIVPLGSWVLAEACREARVWRQHPLHGDLSIGVNISPRQFHQANLVRAVGQALADHELDPAALTLEITEGVLIQDTEEVVSKLFELKEMGVKLALDDFGTGYSSLSYLTRFPIDYLKIDKSFVSGIGVRSPDSRLAAAMIDLAHTLGLRPVAEGVEDSLQLSNLRAMGCEYAQGYYISRPLTPKAMRDFLETSPAAAA